MSGTVLRTLNVVGCALRSRSGCCGTVSRCHAATTHLLTRMLGFRLVVGDRSVGRADAARLERVLDRLVVWEELLQDERGGLAELAALLA